MDAMTNAEFAKLIVHAIAVSVADGISGWGMNNPDSNLFDEVEISGSYGCTDSMCNHNSHDPAAPTIKIVPKNDRYTIINIGCDDCYTYYALVSKDKRPGDLIHFMRYSEDRGYHDSIRVIQSSEVPHWCLMNMVTMRKDR